MENIEKINLETGEPAIKMDKNEFGQFLFEQRKILKNSNRKTATKKNIETEIDVIDTAIFYRRLNIEQIVEFLKERLIAVQEFKMNRTMIFLKTDFLKMLLRNTGLYYDGKYQKRTMRKSVTYRTKATVIIDDLENSAHLAGLSAADKPSAVDGFNYGQARTGANGIGVELL